MTTRASASTIVAVATPPGVGGVAIVRLSGPRALPVGEALFRSAQGGAWTSHTLRFGKLSDPSTGETLDRCLAVLMRAPHSYTGEDVFEFQLHGSPVLCERTVELCTEQGARLAQPGEFTQRAYLNGRLDLAQAESVLDLIESRTEAQAKMAAAHLEGSFSKRVDRVRRAVLDWLALLEAEIDFGDEIDELDEIQHLRHLEPICADVESLLGDAHRGRLQLRGLRTVLVGAPNAGKSSLLNALIEEERALVTDIPGTTRDRIEVDCSRHGVLLNLIDTAGLREETDDAVERLGIEKTYEALKTADYVVLVVDGHRPQFDFPGSGEIVVDLLVLTKGDLGFRVSEDELRQRYPTASYAFCDLISESGRDRALEAVLSAARARLTETSGECFSLNQRHRESLVRARDSLRAVAESVRTGHSSEFVALDLRRVAVALGEILGLDVTEEVLDRIFGQFCLGK